MGSLDQRWAECFFANVSWGLGYLHLALAVLFFEAGVALMIVLNLACLLASSISIRLVRNGRFRAYTLTVFLAELLNLTVSAACVGWSSGFQIPLLGLAAFMFFIEYLSRSIGVPFVPALPLGIADFAVYVLTFLFCFQNPGLLSIPESIVHVVEILWSILVFAAMIVGLYFVVRMTSDSEKVLNDKAQTDRLTGLYNRAGFDRLCGETPLNTTALLIIDTDKFKGINDRYGHETGDRVLQKISRELMRNFRYSDHVCRIGGDEFAVLMVETEALEAESIKSKIDRINRELAHSAYDQLPHVSVSVGVAHGSGADDWTELYKQADSVLYQVKQVGGRGCRFYQRK